MPYQINRYSTRGLRILNLTGKVILPALAACIETTVLLGWWDDIAILGPYSAALPEPKPHTALCLLAISIALLIPDRFRLTRIISTALALLAGSLALVILIEWILGKDLGISFLSVPNSGLITPGNMALQSATTIVVLASAVTMARWRGTKWWPVQIAIAIAMSSALVAIARRLSWAIPDGWSVQTFAGMSATSSASILLLSLSLYLSHPEQGTSRLIVTRGISGRIARLLPVTLIFSVITIVFLHVARASSVTQAAELWSLLIIMLILLPTVTITIIANILDHSEQRREAAEISAKTLIDNASEAIAVLNTEDKCFISLNPEAKRMFQRSSSDIVGMSPADLSPIYQPDGKTSQEAITELFDKTIHDKSITFDWLFKIGEDELLCEIRLIVLPGTQPPLLRASMVDVGEQRRAEREHHRLAAERLAAEVRAQTFALARARAERISEQRAILLRLTHDLGSTTGVTHVAESIASAATQALGASTAALLFVTQSHEIIFHSFYGFKPKSQRQFPLAQSPLMTDVVDSASPILLGSREEREKRYPDIEYSPDFPEAWALLPLTINNTVIGIVCFGWQEARCFDKYHFEFFRAVATHCSTTFERAKLFDAERDARTVAENAQTQLSILAEVGSIVAESIEEDTLRQGITRLLTERMSDWCGMYQPDEDGILVLVDDAPHDSALAHNDPFQDMDGKPSITIPMIARGHSIGVINLVRVKDHAAFNSDDEQILTDIGRRVGAALDNLRLLASRTRVATRLQESLLPQELPAVPHVEMAVRYITGDENADVGGDFYDAFSLGDDDYAFVIGDVSGRGIDAAGLTGLARTTLRALGNGVGPASSLTRLNELLIGRQDTERFLTAAYLRIGPRKDTGTLATICLAGHPPPLVVTSTGATRWIGKPGSLLGVIDTPHLFDETIYLQPGDTIVMYTDGVIEAKGPDGLFGDDRLEKFLIPLANNSAEDIVTSLEQSLRDYQHRAGDDTALMVIRILPPRTPGQRVLMDLRFPVEATTARQARHAVARLAGQILPPELIDDLTIAVSELVTNAVVQVRRQPTLTLRPDPIQLRILQRPGVLRIEIHNPGSTFTLPYNVPIPNPLAERGRGLMLVRALSSRMGVDSTNGATCVWIEVDLPHGMLATQTLIRT